MSWLMPLLRPTGLIPRMTADQQANSNIEPTDGDRTDQIPSKGS
jgi:hypothetical protein